MTHKNCNWISKTFVLSRNVVTSTFIDNPWFLYYHWNTWFQWVILGSSSIDILGAPNFPPAGLIPGGRGRLHPVRLGIWRVLSLLEQCTTDRSHPPPPIPHLVMIVTLCQWAERLGVLFSVTFPPVMPFRYRADRYCFLCRKYWRKWVTFSFIVITLINLVSSPTTLFSVKKVAKALHGACSALNT